MAPFDTNNEYWATLLSRDDDAGDFDSDTDLEDDVLGPGSGPSDLESTVTPTGHVDMGNTPGDATTALVKDVLAYMTNKGLTLAKFLHCISWGDPTCIIDGQIRGARTALMNSAELPVMVLVILEILHVL